MLLMKIQDSVQHLKGVGPKKSGAGAPRHRAGLRPPDVLPAHLRGPERPDAHRRPAAGHGRDSRGTIVNLQEQTAARPDHPDGLLLNDGTGILQVTWFNQKYLKKTLKAGRRVFVSGKAAYAYGGRGQFAMSQLRSFQVLEPGEQAAGLCGILPRLRGHRAPKPEVLPHAYRGGAGGSRRSSRAHPCAHPGSASSHGAQGGPVRRPLPEGWGRTQAGALPAGLLELYLIHADCCS